MRKAGNFLRGGSVKLGCGAETRLLHLGPIDLTARTAQHDLGIASENTFRDVTRWCTYTKKMATVVLVDDDPSVLSAMARLIRVAGFHVLTFSTPSAVIAATIPSTDACLVVDINLPGMNGIELCAALTASGRGLPFILITGRGDARILHLGQSATAVAILFKPVDEDPLMAAIGHGIALSKSSRKGN